MRGLLILVVLGAWALLIWSLLAGWPAHSAVDATHAGADLCIGPKPVEALTLTVRTDLGGALLVGEIVCHASQAAADPVVFGSVLPRLPALGGR